MNSYSEGLNEVVLSFDGWHYFFLFFKYFFHFWRLTVITLLATLRYVTIVAWDGWIDATSRKTRATFYCRPSWTVCFRRVSRREDNGETDKSLYVIYNYFNVNNFIQL